MAPAERREEMRPVFISLFFNLYLPGAGREHTPAAALGPVTIGTYYLIERCEFPRSGPVTAMGARKIRQGLRPKLVCLFRITLG